MEKLYQEGEEIKHKTKVGLLVPLLSIFIKESKNRLYLFVSKIATSLSGNSSIQVDTILVTKWRLHWGATRLFVSLSIFVSFINLQMEPEVKPTSL